MLAGLKTKLLPILLVGTTWVASHSGCDSGGLYSSVGGLYQDVGGYLFDGGGTYGDGGYYDDYTGGGYYYDQPSCCEPYYGDVYYDPYAW